jgi:DNA recombination protein RmuC
LAAHGKQVTLEIVFLLIGLLVGAAAVWLVMRVRVASLDAALDHERRAASERVSSRAELETTMKALSADLQKDARDDLESRQRAVERLIAPLRESLERVTAGVQELEKSRSASQGALSAQIHDLVDAQARLQAETSSLAASLRSSGSRGRWGELQLRRVVELAGMVAYCDFVEQQTLAADGRTLRPDLIVRLPGGLNIVIDAKAPFDAYLQATNASGDEARRAYAEHARRLREHVAALSAREYWKPFEPTPGFVVLFVPAEPLFHAALEHDPSLIEDAARQGVVLASPASLIALLRSVAEGWRQETIAESAREVSLLGKQLYERLATLAGHFAKLRKGLDTAVVAYNDAIGSLERNVLVAARRFPDLGVPAAKEIVELDPIEHATRAPQAPELVTRVPGVGPGGVAGAGPDEDVDDGVLDAA